MTVKSNSSLEGHSNLGTEDKQKRLSYKVFKVETFIGDLEKKASAISSLIASSTDSNNDYFDKGISYIEGQISRVLGERLKELIALGATRDYIGYITTQCETIRDTLEKAYSNFIQARALEFKEAARERSERKKMKPAPYHTPEYSKSVTRRGSDDSSEGVRTAFTQFYERLD
jgi:hypothetical protein